MFSCWRLLEKLERRFSQKGEVNGGVTYQFQIEQPPLVPYLECLGKNKPTEGKRNFYDYSIQNGTLEVLQRTIKWNLVSYTY